MHFGLLGHPLHHSFSQKYFTNRFSNLNLEFVYENYDYEDVKEFCLKFKNSNILKGFNVTIPHKTAIIPFLDDIHPSAKEINAVNVVKNANGKWIGYNTDVIGFQFSLMPLLEPHHTTALILGNGGASKAVAYVLKKLNIEFKIVSRTPKEPGNLSYSELNKEIIEHHLLIINTTPLGMYPDIHNCPNVPYEYLTYQHLCYDLIYNPKITQFLNNAKEKGAVIKNGEEMLLLQAEAAWDIWQNDNC